MSNKILILLVVILLVAGGGYLVTKSYGQSPNPAPSATTVTTTNSRVKFDSSPASKFAYQIFPGPISAEAKTALAGFMLDTKTQSDGSSLITMTSTNTEYKNQTYTVKPAEILYFIEKNPKDDSESENAEKFLADDTAVVVDADGYIVQ